VGSLRGRIRKLERQANTTLVVVNHEDGTSLKFREEPFSGASLYRGAKDGDEPRSPDERAQGDGGVHARRGREHPGMQGRVGAPVRETSPRVYD
jgi:hypothetical protein